ncbi:MAG: sugar ABC transporter substrate-binding protein [Chloroflexi bacterium]|nr:sugar ABC transporter substrate-binding protein [Chloroflexota bacterium]
MEQAKPLRPTRRRALALGGVLGVLSTPLGAACRAGASGPAEPKGNKPAANTQPATIEFHTNQAAAPFASLETSLAAFRQRHPQITVNVTNTPGATYTDKLQTLIAGGTAPDMFRLGGDVFAAFYVLKVLAPLDPLIKRDKFDLGDFYPSSLEVTQWGKRQLGLPSGFGYRVLFYNAELFKKEGLSLPPGEWNAPGWSFDDFVKIARQLTKRGEGPTQWGFVSPRASWQIWLYAGGGRAISPTHDEVWITRPEAVAALQAIGDLETKHLVGQTPDETREMSADTAFLAGRAAMWQSSLNTGTTTARRATGFTWDATPPPRGPKAAGMRKTFRGGSAWHLGASSKVQEASWTLLQFLLSKEVVTQAAKEGYAPERKSVVNSPAWLDPSLPPKSKKVITDGFDGIIPFPKLITWTEWIQIANRELNPLWNGTRTAAEVAAAVKTATEPLMERHRQAVQNDKP